VNLSQLLKGREFVSFASADLKGQPNNAPKMLLKFEKPYIYLIEFSYGRTHDNLKANPQACLSFMDLENIEGYRIYGTVELIEKGPEFKALAKELEKKQIQLSTTRVIHAVRTGKKYEHFELEMPDKFSVIKFKIVEITKIGTRGDFFREKDRRKVR
jgi:general stress protein 26